VSISFLKQTHIPPLIEHQADSHMTQHETTTSLFEQKWHSLSWRWHYDLTWQWQTHTRYTTLQSARAKGKWMNNNLYVAFWLAILPWSLPLSPHTYGGKLQQGYPITFPRLLKNQLMLHTHTHSFSTSAPYLVLSPSAPYANAQMHSMGKTRWTFLQCSDFRDNL